jgi:hypothetical protein
MRRPVEAVSTAVYSVGLSPYRRGNPDPGSRSQRQDRPGLDDLKNEGPSNQPRNWPHHQTRSLRSREHLRMPPSTCGSASGFIPQISRDPWPAPATSGIRLPTTATRRQQPPPAFMPITGERLRPGQAPGRIPQPASQLLQLPFQAGEHVPAVARSSCPTAATGAPQQPRSPPLTRVPSHRSMSSRFRWPARAVPGSGYGVVWRRWVRAVWRRPAPGVRTAWASARRDPTRTMSCLARVTPV